MAVDDYFGEILVKAHELDLKKFFDELIPITDEAAMILEYIRNSLSNTQ